MLSRHNGKLDYARFKPSGNVNDIVMSHGVIMKAALLLGIGYQPGDILETMASDRRQALDAVGFVWDVWSAQWEAGFRALQDFQQREGHCHVPAKYRFGGFGLGQWVRRQREEKEQLTFERRQRLNALGFIWDSPSAAHARSSCN